MHFWFISQYYVLKILVIGHDMSDLKVIYCIEIQPIINHGSNTYMILTGKSCYIILRSQTGDKWLVSSLHISLIPYPFEDCECTRMFIHGHKYFSLRMHMSILRTLLTCLILAKRQAWHSKEMEPTVGLSYVNISGLLAKESFLCRNYIRNCP